MHQPVRPTQRLKRLPFLATHPSLTAWAMGTGRIERPASLSLISIWQGSPILNGKAVSSLTFEGTYIQTLVYSLPLLEVFLPMTDPMPLLAISDP